MGLTKVTYSMIDGAPINVLDFGAVGDGVTDDTVAIQNAIDYALSLSNSCVQVPAGRYKLTDTITINTSSNQFSLIGEGQGASIFVRNTDYGDTFALTTCPQSLFENFGIQMSVEMTTGAHFNCDGLYRTTFNNLFLTEPFIGILMNNCTSVFISNTVIQGGKYFSDVTYKPNSALLKLKAGTGAGNNGIAISNCFFDPSGLPPETHTKYEIALWVECVDGLWVENTHIMGGYEAHVGITPVTGYVLSGIKFSNCWLDYWATKNLLIDQDGTTVVQDVSFSNCTFQGATDELFYVNSPYLVGLTFSSCIFEFAAHQAGTIYGANEVSINGCIFKSNNGGTPNGSTLIISGANVQNVSITGGIMYAGPNVNYNINTGVTPPTNMIVSGVSFGNATITDVYYAGTVQPFNVIGCINQNIQITAAFSLDISTATDTMLVSGTTGINQIVGNRGWPNRQITLTFLNALTVTPSTNLVMPAGAFTTSATNLSTLQLVCIDGTKWVEVSRRA